MEDQVHPSREVRSMEDQVRHVPCPYHEGAEPTLAIDLQSGRYRCERCGAAGALTPHGEEQLLLERRGRNPVLPEAMDVLQRVE